MNLWNRWDCGAKKNSFPSLMTEQEQNKKKILTAERSRVRLRVPAGVAPSSPTGATPPSPAGAAPPTDAASTVGATPPYRHRPSSRRCPSLPVSPIQPVPPLPTSAMSPACRRRPSSRRCPYPRRCLTYVQQNRASTWAWRWESLLIWLFMLLYWNPSVQCININLISLLIWLFMLLY
jgi:hypothetical protein